MDFGPPRGPFSRLVARLMRGHANIADNLEGRLPQLMREAGLCSVNETDSVTRLLGWRQGASEIIWAAGAWAGQSTQPTRRFQFTGRGEGQGIVLMCHCVQVQPPLLVFGAQA